MFGDNINYYGYLCNEYKKWQDFKTKNSGIAAKASKNIRGTVATIDIIILYGI